MSIRVFLLSPLASVLLAALLSACGEETGVAVPRSVIRDQVAASGTGEARAHRGYPLAVRDADGRAIRMERRPERIVVLATPLYTEILFDLDAGERVVGVCDSPDNPPDAASVEKVGKSLSWSLERVISLRPDVVFGAGRNIDRIESAGITVVTAGGPGGIVRGVEDVLESMRTVDLVVNGDTQRAERLARRIRRDLAAVEDRIRGRPRPGAVFVYAPRQFAPTVAGSDTPEHEILTMAGARNVFEDIDAYKTVNLEQLILRDPDVIVTNIDQASKVLDDPGLQGLRAVKQGKVIGVRSSKITSSRVAAILRRLAGKIHPSAFSDG